MELEGKRVIVVVGEATAPALRTAALARELGAEVLVAGPEALLADERHSLASQPDDVLALDITRPDSYSVLHQEVSRRWARLDGAVHAGHPVPQAGGGGPAEEIRLAERGFLTTAYSLSALARAVLPVMEGSQPSGSIVALTFDPGVQQGLPDWMGAAGTALEAVNRYLACALGPRGMRVNVVAAGSDGDDGTVARLACFLLSDWARAVTGEVVRVDGG